MFSVVIPLYNKELTLRRSIESVLDQKYTDFELIIVNDGSTDHSLAIARSFNDSRVHLISQPNMGVSAARNKGIHAAKYSYIAFLDADDFWEPDYLLSMVELIRTCPDACLYGCAYDKIDKKNVAIHDFQLPDDFLGYIPNYFDLAKKHPFFCSSAVILNKEFPNNNFLFDESLHTGEDIDLWITIALNHPVAFRNKVLAHYNLGAENRAMRIKRRYSTSILSHLAKYDQMEKENEAFKLYLNLLRIQFIPELFLHYNATKKEIIDYLNSIDSRGQAFKHRLFLFFVPYWLKKKLLAALYASSFK